MKQNVIIMMMVLAVTLLVAKLLLGNPTNPVKIICLILLAIGISRKWLRRLKNKRVRVYE